MMTQNGYFFDFVLYNLHNNNLPTFIYFNQLSLKERCKYKQNVIFVHVAYEGRNYCRKNA